MGACCAGKETKSDSRNEELNWKIYKSQFHSELRHVTTPKIEMEVDHSIFSRNLNDLIEKFLNHENNKNNNSLIQKLPMERLWNIHKFYLDDFTNSDFIICDLRENSDKTENFLKKFKQINYSLDEIKMLNENQLTRFRKFLNSKNLILILKEEKFKLGEELISFLLNKNVISHNSQIFLLDNNMSISDLNKNHKIFYELQDRKSFDIFPFILFPLKIFPHLKTDSLIFFDFLKVNENSPHPIEMMNNLENKNKPNEFCEFLQSFNITNVLIVKNETNEKIGKNGIIHQKEIEELVPIPVNSQESGSNFQSSHPHSSIPNNFSNISHLNIKIGNLQKIYSKMIKLTLSSIHEYEEKKDFLNFQFFSVRKDILSNGSFLILMDNSLNLEVIVFMIFLTIWKIADFKPYHIKNFVKDNFLFVKNLSEICDKSEILEK